MEPVRIQRKRTKGWKMPPNTVYVGRPTKWGNPFRVGGYFKIGDPDPSRRDWLRMLWCEATPGYEDDSFTLIEHPSTAVEMFSELMQQSPWKVEPLRGKNLACWCPLNQPCHADILLELANSNGGSDG